MQEVVRETSGEAFIYCTYLDSLLLHYYHSNLAQFWLDSFDDFYLITSIQSIDQIYSFDY
jgi:hypothetical protein